VRKKGKRNKPRVFVPRAGRDARKGEKVKSKKLYDAGDPEIIKTTDEREQITYLKEKTCRGAR